MDLVYGIDLSYSVNKKSYNLIESTNFDKFCIESEGIKGGLGSIKKIVSFGDDRYGLIYANHGSNDDEKKELITGFTFDKGQYHVINESVKKALSKIENYSSSTKDIIISNTSSAQQAVIFDNTSSQFKTIDLFDKSEQEQIKKDKDYKQTIQDLVIDDNDDKEEKKKEEEEDKETTKVNGASGDKQDKSDKQDVDDKDKNKDTDKTEDADQAKKKEKSDKKESKDKKKRKKSSKSSSSPKYKVKSTIKKVFKHLLLTSNGSLYEISKSFHKKYVNNNRIVDVKCDGNRCTLCLDENGVLWSFGINLFGKLGLKRNDKKQIYTNPREISIFKAYKVSDFGLTNKCCIACCANGSIYGWGSYSKSDLGKDSNIWYTPRLITTTTKSDTVDYTAPKQKWRVFAGFRFIILLNLTMNKLYCINTEFGYTLLEKPRNNFIIKIQSIKLPKDVVVRDVIPSNESAIIIANKQQT